MNRSSGKSMSGKVVHRADDCCFAVCARPVDEEAWANAACANELSASRATSNSQNSPNPIIYAFLRRYPASGASLYQNTGSFLPPPEAELQPT